VRTAPTILAHSEYGGWTKSACNAVGVRRRKGIAVGVRRRNGIAVGARRRGGIECDRWMLGSPPLLP
jgi:hypothetical protein